MEVQSRRDDSLDGVCGLLIIWMISMHAAQWSGVKGTTFFNVATHVFFYFMPWFYFKGGMFATVKEEKIIVWGG